MLLLFIEIADADRLFKTCFRSRFLIYRKNQTKK